MTINMIAAMDTMYGIGEKGKMPWGFLKSDLMYFQKLTMGHPIIMGRKTYESLPVKPLPGRFNFIITSKPPENYHIEENEQFIPNPISPDLFKNTEEQLWVIGGEQVYRYYLNHADNLYLTRIDRWFNCDTLFPKFTDQFDLDQKYPSIQNMTYGFWYHWEVWKRKEL